MMRRASVFLQDVAKPRDICASVKPILIVSFIVGITPFRIVETENQRRICITLFGFITAILHSVLFIGSFLHSIIRRESLAGYFFNTNISTIGDTLLTFEGLWGISVIFIACIMKRYSLIELMDILIEVDHRFNELGVTIDYSATLKLSWFIIACVLGVNFGYLAGSVQMFNNIKIFPSFTAYITYFSPEIIVSIIVVMFICFVHKIRQRFILLNKVLQGVSEVIVGRYTPLTDSNTNKNKSLFISNVSSKPPGDVIDDAMQIQSLLCDAAATANKYFTYQLLTIVSISFLIIVFDAYYVLETILGQPRKEIQFNTTEFVAFFSCQMALYILAVFAIVEGGSKTITQSESTATYVHKLMNRTKDPELKQKLAYFSMQLVHGKVCFSAAGLFNIDRTLYFTITGAATTYLIILLQFTSSSLPDQLANLQPDSLNLTIGK